MLHFLTLNTITVNEFYLLRIIKSHHFEMIYFPPHLELYEMEKKTFQYTNITQAFRL